jgi:iron-sulfur cluster assembly accessory protein
MQQRRAARTDQRSLENRNPGPPGRNIPGRAPSSIVSKLHHVARRQAVAKAAPWVEKPPEILRLLLESGLFHETADRENTQNLREQMTVTVTERAARRIGEILRQEPAGTMLRASVEGGGCSGFQYKFDTERERADDDIVIEQSGATVLIDPVSLNYMAGSEIDFVDDLIGSSFKINNPKATASCGCGTSFAL